MAEAGADFVKIGIGGGSICITREQKGIGRGQATAVIEVAAARDAVSYTHLAVIFNVCTDTAKIFSKSNNLSYSASLYTAFLLALERSS